MKLFTGLLALCGISKPPVETFSSQPVILDFDEITTVKGLAKVPSPYSHLSFSSYNVFTPGDPAWDGKISRNDRNCAVSAPNALIGSRYDESNPDRTYGAYFQIANTTAMAEQSLNPYFTLSKFKIKPLDSPPEPTTTLITVIGHKYNTNETVKWDVSFDQGYHDPLHVSLEHFSGGNWEELSGVVILADYGVDALDWEFCIDDLELQFSHTNPELQVARQKNQVIMKTKQHNMVNLG